MTLVSIATRSLEFYSRAGGDGKFLRPRRHERWKAYANTPPDFARELSRRECYSASTEETIHT